MRVQKSNDVCQLLQGQKSNLYCTSCSDHEEGILLIHCSTTRDITFKQPFLAYGYNAFSISTN